MAKKKAANQPRTIQNRRARFDYELGDSLVVGLELTGAEVKSLRMKPTGDCIRILDHMAAVLSDEANASWRDSDYIDLIQTFKQQVADLPRSGPSMEQLRAFINAERYDSPACV